MDSHRLKKLSGEQRIELYERLGPFVPYRICRRPPDSVLICHLADQRIGLGNKATTSTLLQILAGMLTKNIIIWDDADKCPDMEKIMVMGNILSDVGFCWDDFRIDPNNPELWEFLPAR